MNDNKDPRKPDISELLFYALVGAGVGTPSLFIFIRENTNNVGDAIKFSVIYLSILVAVTFIGWLFRLLGLTVGDKIRIELRNRIDTIWSLAFDNQQKRYLQRLIALNNKLDYRPLSGPNYSYEINSIFVPLKFQLYDSKDNKEIDLVNLITKFNKNSKELFRFVIIGKPGSGKSTFLKYITIQIAQNRLNFIKSKNFSSKFPIYIDFSQQNFPTDLNQSLAEYLIDCDKNLSVTRTWLEKKLKNGDCFILLDSYDVASETEIKRNIASWVQKQLDDYYKCQFIICSRPVGYLSNALKNVIELGVKDFDSNQIQSFIHKIYYADELFNSALSSVLSNSHGISDSLKSEAKIRADALSDQLQERLREHKAFLNLAINPLLLTMITVVYAARRNLPGRRATLYREMLDVNLDERYRKHNNAHDPLSTDQKAIILGSIAYYMMSRRITSISKHEVVRVIGEYLSATNFGNGITSEGFLELMSKNYGVLIEKEAGEFGFAHQTFQEFLTSRHYYNNEALTSEFISYIGDGWWEEVIRLYSAQIPNATSVLKLCLKQLENDPIPIETLILARNILSEALFIDPDVREDLQKILNSLANDLDPDKWKQSAIAAITARLRFMARLAGDTFIDVSLITNAEYQLFIDAMIKEQHLYYQPDHWLKEKFPDGQALLPVVGVRPSDLDQFVKWIPRFEVSPTIFKIPSTNEALMVNINNNERHYKYFVMQNDNDIFLNNASGLFTSKEATIDIIEKDLRTVGKLKSAAEHSKQRPPTSLELLSRTVPFFDGSGGGFNKPRSDPTHNYSSGQKDEDILTSRFLLLEYKTIADALTLDFDNYITRIYSHFFTDGVIVSLKFDWVTNSSYFTVDIGDGINKFLSYFQSKEISNNDRGFNEQFDSNLMKALKLVQNRKWHLLYSLTEDATIKVAPHRVYNFLRWYCRIGLVDFLFNHYQYGIKNPRHNIGFSETEKLLYEFITLEQRITESSLIVEGIRLVKVC